MYTFKTLPFPAMISLLVSCNVEHKTRNHKIIIASVVYNRPVRVF